MVHVSFSTMKNLSIPGKLPHHPPPLEEQRRILSLAPYVREAQEVMRPAWHFKSRRLFDFLLVHWIDGIGEFSVAGNTFPVGSGDLVWVPPNTPHEMRGHAPGTLLQFIHFDLTYHPQGSHWSAHIPGGTNDLTAWSSHLHPPLEDPVLKSWCGKINGGGQAVITETLRRIILEYNRTQTSGLMISALVCQLISHLLSQQNPAQPGSNRHSQTLERALQQIQLRCHGKLDLSTLARQHGLSPTHFRKLFREQYRQSPREAHLKAKMRIAYDCLNYSSLTISEIADRLGFTNVHNFSRAFRNAVGKSPGAWRIDPSTTA